MKGMTLAQQRAENAETLRRAKELLAQGVGPDVVSLRLGLAKGRLTFILREDRQRRGEDPPARNRKPVSDPTGRPRFGGAPDLHSKGRSLPV